MATSWSVLELVPLVIFFSLCKTTNIYYLIQFMKVRNVRAEWFWLRGHKVAVQMSGGAVSSEGLTGAWRMCFQDGVLHGCKQETSVKIITWTSSHSMAGRFHQSEWCRKGRNHNLFYDVALEVGGDYTWVWLPRDRDHWGPTWKLTISGRLLWFILVLYVFATPGWKMIPGLYFLIN